MNLKGLGFLAGGIVGFTAGAIAAAAVLTEALEQAVLEGKLEAKKKIIEVGDEINWESQGTLMFTEPKEVIRIVDSEEHGKYVFVDGEDTGIPYDQCVKA